MQKCVKNHPSGFTIIVVASCLAAAVGVACGGSSSAGSQPPALPVAVSISPASATVAEGGQQQLTAAVLNISDTALNWLVDGVSGGNGTVGTITPSGLYTAPPSSGSHAVVAVAADGTKSAAATVVVNAQVTTTTPPAPPPPPTPPTPPGGGGTAPPSNSTNYANIEQMGGWSSCGACAGVGGKGPNVPFSLTQYVGSPSIDGKAAHFWIGGKTPFGDALWWKELGANANASHFLYDLYFYYTNAGAPQALEFDGNQTVGGRKYIFGTQCNVAAGQWDVWNTAGAAWVHTGIACAAPPTNNWNHLVLEFERVNGQTHFIAVTLNGNKSYINRYFNSKAWSGSELNVAFQMDETSRGTNYDVWLDKVNLSAW